MLGLLHDKIATVIPIVCVRDAGGAIEVVYDQQPDEQQRQQIDAFVSGYPTTKALYELRMKRDAMLVASDWRMLAGSPGNRDAWAEYRQQLRDLPQVFAGDVSNVVWPTEPT